VALQVPKAAQALGFEFECGQGKATGGLTASNILTHPPPCPKGLDMTRAAESHLKSRAIERIRRKYPYNNIIMVGGGRQQPGPPCLGRY